MEPLSGEKRRCGLCSKSKRLIETECCGRLICDDEDAYVTFSYARNSCSRNHRRLTLCGYHHAEGHVGSWKDCSACRRSFETEMYVWYGTNAYNFEKLENPPPYEPTRCARCGAIIRLSEEEYSVLGTQYTCVRCMTTEKGSPIRRTSVASRRRVRPRDGGAKSRRRRARLG